MCNIFFPVALRIPFSSSLTLPTLTATLEFYVCFFEDSFLDYSRILAFLGSPSLIFCFFTLHYLLGSSALFPLFQLLFRGR